MRTAEEVEARAEREERARKMFDDGASAAAVAAALEICGQDAHKLRAKLKRRPVRVSMGITPVVTKEEAGALLSCRGLLAMLHRAAS